MTETRIADNVAWHLKKEVKKIKQQGNKTPGDARIDAKFKDWAKRNGVDLNIPLMTKDKLP
jgi:hypothetical protein